MSNPIWNLLSLPTLPTGVTGKKVYSENSNCWLLASDGQVHKSSFGSWASTAATAQIESLSVATDSSAIGIDVDHQAHFCFGSWSSLGTSATAVAIGDYQNYIIANGSNVTAYTPTGIKDVSSTVHLKQISATANLDYVWGVDGTGAIYSLAGTSWIAVPGPTGVSVASVHLSVSSGVLQAYCLDGMGNGYWYEGGAWTGVFNPTYWLNGFASLQGGIGMAHALMTNGELFAGNI